MLQSEFQVTLPSTSSIRFYPQNKPSHYNTMLKSPLHLEGEWEVALMDIQYPFNWNNFPGGEIAVIIQVRGVDGNSHDLQFQSHTADLQTKQTSNRYKLYDDSLSKELRFKATDYYMERHIDYTAIIVVKIPPGYFKTVEALMSAFTDYFNNDNFEGPSAVKIFSVYNQITKVSKLSFENIQWCDVICRGNDFFKASGIKADDIGDNYFRSSIMGLVTGPSELPTISTMYVYTDIIKWQRVGDNEAPLLATLPIHGNPAEQLFWSFNPPYYIPVAQETINSIEIKLTTDEGELFPIEIPGKVICRLNFRRRRFGL